MRKYLDKFRGLIALAMRAMAFFAYTQRAKAEGFCYQCGDSDAAWCATQCMANSYSTVCWCCYPSGEYTDCSCSYGGGQCSDWPYDN